MITEQPLYIKNLNNYGPYAELITNKKMYINIREINLQNYEMHYNSVLNIMKDAIETEYCRSVFLDLSFGVPMSNFRMSLQDYWINLIMWYMIIATKNKIEPRHIFFSESVTKMDIKRYIDKYFLEEYGADIDVIELNNIIDDSMYRMFQIDKFSLYLANTINLEDYVDLMKSNPRFNELMHIGINCGPEDEKSEGTRLTAELIDIIKHSSHAAANFFRAGEGINKKQFKEFALRKGAIPNGQGGIYPKMMETSFIQGGTLSFEDYFMESQNGRIAQIIVENNVGGAGALARLLGMNSSDTQLHWDKNYKCDTKNLIPIYVEDESMLFDFEGRFYKFRENGPDFCIKNTDRHLIGRHILLYSPMTCASKSRGDGVCYRCYGKLANFNKDINIGKLAAELFSSVITQKMLSAKHLLEAAVMALLWNKEFEDFFYVDFNIVKCRDDVPYDNISMIINPNDIVMEDDEQEIADYGEYIESFSVLVGNKRIECKTEKVDKLYISSEFTDYIKRKAKPYGDEELIIPLKEFQENEDPLFAVKLYNNDLNAILEQIKGIINSKAITEKMNMQELLITLRNKMKEGGINLTSIHSEIILSNQIRDINTITEVPDWSIPNVEYNIRTLKGALKDNPSLTVSLTFEGIKKALYNPLTFTKYKPSIFDLFFMPNPAAYLDENPNVVRTGDNITKENEDGSLTIFKRVED